MNGIPMEEVYEETSVGINMSKRQKTVKKQPLVMGTMRGGGSTCYLTKCWGGGWYFLNTAPQ